VATKFKPGEKVFVPVSLLPDPDSYGTALVHRPIATQQGRKVTITLSGGTNSAPIATSKLHKKAGILIVRIGDFASEASLLDPLAKSILHFSRLFLDESFVRLLEVRSLSQNSRHILRITQPTSPTLSSQATSMAHLFTSPLAVHRPLPTLVPRWPQSTITVWPSSL
jgi:hypothetical protein